MAQPPTFLGCCTSEACNGNGGCPAADLRAAGLGPGNSSYYPNVNCPDNGLWYTCAETNPTFQGCCISNPCHIGGACPRGNLFPAAWGTASSTSTSTSSSSKLAPTSIQLSTLTSLSPKSTVIPATTSTVVSTVTTVVNGQTTAAVSTVTVVNGRTTAAIAGSSTSSVAPLPAVPLAANTNLPMIIGAAVGGGVGAIAILAIVAFLVRRCLKKKRRSPVVASDSPRPGDAFLGKGPDTPQTPYNDGKSSSFLCVYILIGFQKLIILANASTVSLQHRKRRKYRRQSFTAQLPLHIILHIKSPRTGIL